MSGISNDSSYSADLRERPNYYIPSYSTAPKVYELRSSKPLSALQRAHNQTINQGNVIDSTQFAIVGIRLLQRFFRCSDDGFNKKKNIFERHIQYVDSICHMTPIEYLQNDKIPLIQKIFDLTIGVPIAGTIELISVATLPITASIVVTIELIIFISLILPIIVCCGTICCNRRDNLDDLSRKSIWEGISIMAKITSGSLASGLRASLKLVPIFGMTAIKTFDVGLAAFAEKNKIQPEGYKSELRQFA